jgi:hypothetical protein
MKSHYSAQNKRIGGIGSEAVFHSQHYARLALAAEPSDSIPFHFPNRRLNGGALWFEQSGR